MSDDERIRVSLWRWVLDAALAALRRLSMHDHSVAGVEEEFGDPKRAEETRALADRAYKAAEEIKRAVRDHDEGRAEDKK